MLCSVSEDIRPTLNVVKIYDPLNMILNTLCTYFDSVQWAAPKILIGARHSNKIRFLKTSAKYFVETINYGIK